MSMEEVVKRRDEYLLAFHDECLWNISIGSEKGCMAKENHGAVVLVAAAAGTRDFSFSWT